MVEPVASLSEKYGYMPVRKAKYRSVKNASEAFMCDMMTNHIINTMYVVTNS